MTGNKVFKHKYILLFLVIVFFAIFGKIDVHAEESTLNPIHITSYYYRPDYSMPYGEAIHENYSSENIVLLVRNLDEGVFQFVTDNPDGFYLYFKDANITTIKRYDSNMVYHDEYLQEKCYNVYFYETVISNPEMNAGFIYSNWRSLETNLPIFKDIESCKAYFETGDTSGQINKPLESIYDDTIEAPALYFPNFSKNNIDYTCFITNSTDKYYIEVQGRCHSMDDIEFYKDKIYWKTKYYTLLKNDLSTWISYDDSVLSTGEHDFAVYASESFQNLLTLYPVESRNIFGGTNAIGDFFSGYSAVLGQLKKDLSNIHSSGNTIEFYVRFYYIENNKIKYGKWCHAFNSATEDMKDFQFFQSNIGLDDNEKNTLENSSESMYDNDVSSNLYKLEISSLDDDSLWGLIKNLVFSLGDFPELVKSVFSFMPDWFFNLIAIGISFIVILRFLGR